MAEPQPALTGVIGVEFAAAAPLAVSKSTADVMVSGEDSLATFYAAEYPRLASALTLYCGDRELAAELAQEAMARACRHWHRVQHLQSPAGWVHRVAINLANSAFQRRLVRQRARHHAVEHVEDRRDLGAALAVRAAVSNLPRRQRTALVFRYFADLPVDEVAALMKCSPNTVKSLTHQAIANLRRNAALADNDDGDHGDDEGAPR